MHSAATISAVDISLVEPASLEDLSQISNELKLGIAEHENKDYLGNLIHMLNCGAGANVKWSNVGQLSNYNSPCFPGNSFI